MSEQHYRRYASADSRGRSFGERERGRDRERDRDRRGHAGEGYAPPTQYGASHPGWDIPPPYAGGTWLCPPSWPLPPLPQSQTSSPSHACPPRPPAWPPFPPPWPPFPPPHAPRAMRDTRSVTPPPPRSPSPSYLAVAEQAPSRTSDPSSSRKLLILDLNGTLLHRSPHVHRPKQRHHHEDRPRDEQGNLLPRLRPVHPRPYMRAFRSYLFAPQTREWLDVMVWSSAQPHSVRDMVDKCFSEDKDKLLDVWARDTLGLSEDHYHRKVQTVKDLNKPWSYHAPKASDASSSPHLSAASTPRSSPEPSSPSRPSDETVLTATHTYSALTTLLLDDSPRKAELQPFNHVCIGEYSGERRAKDLESLQKEQEWTSALEARQLLDAQMADNQGSTAAESAAQIESSDAPPANDGTEHVQDASRSAAAEESAQPPEAETSKKRKRKHEKLQKRAALLEQLGAGGKPDVSYDETLLAVVGVLDEIKSQANVAAWIRSGGLWGPFGPPVVRSSKGKAKAIGNEDEADDLPSEESTSSTAAVASDEQGTQSGNCDLSVKDAPSAEGNDQANSSHSGKAKNRGRKRQRMRDTSTGEQRAEAMESAADVGNDEETVVPASEAASAPGEEVEAPQKMWFEDQRVLSYWAERGRKALEELGIPVEHGIER